VPADRGDDRSFIVFFHFVAFLNDVFFLIVFDCSMSPLFVEKV